MSRAAADAQKRARAAGTPKLRVSQIIVQLVLVNEHDAPLRPAELVFEGNADGTAAENLAAWMADLPAHLVAAGAQLASPSPVVETV